MRIRTGPDFEIQCILYDKQQNPDCAVRIAVKRALLDSGPTRKCPGPPHAPVVEKSWLRH